MALRTIADIATELGIPESTARFYRKRFVAFVPSVGEGRSKRYPPEAVDVLRFICESMRAKVAVADIQNALGSRFPVTVEPQPGDETAAAVQQQSLVVALAETLRDMVTERDATQAKKLDALMDELHALRKEVSALREAQEQRKRRWWWPW